MRLFYLFSLTALCLFIGTALYGQQTNPTANTTKNQAATQAGTENIYTIKQQYLYNVLHNPTDKNTTDDDNDLERFNRWFHDVEVRCYPTGNLPRPDVLLTAQQQAAQRSSLQTKRTTSAGAVWQPVGPMTVPSNFNGIGRINCIVIDPIDTNTLYIGSACGGVHISHDGGNTWMSSTDNFPSLSIADIAVNPRNTDTIYAATGDGYGYETGGYYIFWGGLYSAGVMMSADGGNTWNTTGLSYLQSDQDIIQKLLIHPNNPNILLAATRNGISRSTNAGATWSNVYTLDHVYSMAFEPFAPDTVYAVNNTDLIVSYDAGATWITLYPGINPTTDRATIAVSPVAPNAIWVLNANDTLQWSHDGGQTFTPTHRCPADTASFYGYYDRVLSVSPTDSNYVLACGEFMAITQNGGNSWNRLNDHTGVHVDNHAFTFNPLRPATMYTGNDGGICVTRNGGATWQNLGNGLMISQIYRMSTSQQSPYVMISGLQDNGSFTFDSTNWYECTGGDGEACAIHPFDDYLQISSSQNGYFNMSYDRGTTFSHLNISSETADWTAPVVFDPNSDLNIYFGYQDIFATYDGGSTFSQVTIGAPFPNGATALAIAPSNSNVLYAADFSHILRTLDGGATWTNVTGTLPTATVAITYIAVDPQNPMRVLATFSGYTSGQKVYFTNDGGGTWVNISGGLPNIPADCIAIDSSTPGALFVGTDMGVYYTDSSMTGWSIYHTGLPNVIANDLNINYANYKVRVATYGRGIWECNLKKPMPTGVLPVASSATLDMEVYPNPTKDNWKLVFPEQKPANYTIKVTDEIGRTVHTQQNSDIIDASTLASGIYNIEVFAGESQYNIKAIRE